MTRNDLVREFRVFTQDQVAPYLWENSTIEHWLAEAEREACIRGRLLHEADDPGVCEIQVEADVASYPLNPALYELTHLAYKDAGETCRRPLKLVSTEYLDAAVPGWRDRTGRVEYAIQGDTSLRLVPRPEEPGMVLLEGYRLPRQSLGSTCFEIHEAHHRNLLDWALFRAFSVPDAETLDLDRSAVAEKAFTDYFGERPDSDLRRITREDVEHHNKAWI